MIRSAPPVIPYWIATREGWWFWVLVCAFVAICWQFPILLLVSLLVLLRAADQWVTWRLLAQFQRRPPASRDD